MSTNKIYYIIYKTSNNFDCMFYIGKHITKDINDSYLGSGHRLKNAIKKYGRINFKKETLYIFETEEEMNVKEAEIVNEEFVARDDTYNIALGGFGSFAHIDTKGSKNPFYGKKHSKENKLKIANRPYKSAEEHLLAKPYLIENVKTNYRITTKCLSKWCRDNNMNLSTFQSLVARKNTSKDGFKVTKL